MTITKPILENTFTLVLFALTVLLICTGCESRTFTAERPDGTRITYSRVSVIGDSSSEGVSVSKQGDNLAVNVGATGSQAKVELIGAMLEAIR